MLYCLFSCGCTSTVLTLFYCVQRYAEAQCCIASNDYKGIIIYPEVE